MPEGQFKTLCDVQSYEFERYHIYHHHQGCQLNSDNRISKFGYCRTKHKIIKKKKQKKSREKQEIKKKFEVMIKVILNSFAIQIFYL